MERKDFGAINGWDAEHILYEPADLPTYVGFPSFLQLPVVTDPAAIRERKADVAILGAPLDEATTHRPGARFGPRAIRQASNTTGLGYSLQLDIEADMPWTW